MIRALQGSEHQLDTWEAFIDFNYKLQASVKGGKTNPDLWLNIKLLASAGSEEHQ